MRLLACVVALMPMVMCAKKTETVINVVPYPQSVEIGKGAFKGRQRFGGDAQGFQNGDFFHSDLPFGMEDGRSGDRRGGSWQAGLIFGRWSFTQLPHVSGEVPRSGDRAPRLSALVQ